MEIEIQLRPERIEPKPPEARLAGPTGAWVQFVGLVRGEEAGHPITALEYEAHSPMAEREMRRLLEDIAIRHPCLFTRVVHRIGVVPVAEAAVVVDVAASHRGEAFSLLTEFMDRLKVDVPIWKCRALTHTGWEEIQRP